ncbi:glycosyl hydrolase family 28-related protein [Parvibaculum sp.]|uniref:glycosyl hydrolase family 28-related protein n=1 Tax=Parvibaculum sp. TaxID=2024848 RepID=UPI002CA16227|nr:glycosyl hydrolase family 28-related protein [Parvibaculum sp.]HUD51135.1 glycosyl hydrolase family 28-related protein [Parvibaculum sp.]
MNRRELFTASAMTMLAAEPAFGASFRDGRPGDGNDHLLSASDFGAKGDGETDDSAALQRALDATFDAMGAKVLVIPPGIYNVGRTLKVDLRPQGKLQPTRQTVIRGHGAVLRSTMKDGSDVLFIESHATARYLLIDGLSIQGNGQEGNGLTLDCNRERAYIYNFCLRDLVVQGCGGDGLRMIGNVFEGQVFNSYFRDNKANGASFGHGPDGGILSALHVFGCVFGGNGQHGAALINKATDVSFHGCYFLLNGAFGVSASNGITLLTNCGFENNHMEAENFAAGDAGVQLQVFGTLVGCTAYSIYKQTHLVRGFITNHLVMVGCNAAGGGKAKGARLAKLQSNGRGKATIVGCQGGIDTVGPFEPAQFGEERGGARFGAQWNSTSLVRLGDYSLWVDRSGKLRIKNGDPSSDGDGSIVGT